MSELHPDGSIVRIDFTDGTSITGEVDGFSIIYADRTQRYHVGPFAPKGAKITEIRSARLEEPTKVGAIVSACIDGRLLPALFVRRSNHPTNPYPQHRWVPLSAGLTHSRAWNELNNAVLVYKGVA